MGLWDIVPDDADPLRRVRTPAVDVYRSLVQAGVEKVGLLPAAPSRAVAGP
jgi:beta-glucosidase